MDTHPVSVAQPLPLADTDRTEWAEIITDWSIAGYKYTRAHERRWLPRVAATTLRGLAVGLRRLCISWANRTLKRADLYAHWDDQGEPDAVLLVTRRDRRGEAPVWTIADHLSRDPGTGEGAALRADVGPLILARADAANAALELTAANEKLADLYAKEIPGLRKRRSTLRGGVTMIRPAAAPTKKPDQHHSARNLRLASRYIVGISLALDLVAVGNLIGDTATRDTGSFLTVGAITTVSFLMWRQSGRLFDLTKFYQLGAKDWTSVSHPLWVVSTAWVAMIILAFLQEQFPALDTNALVRILIPMMGVGSLASLWRNHATIRNLENDPDLQPKVAQVDTTGRCGHGLAPSSAATSVAQVGEDSGGFVRG